MSAATLAYLVGFSAVYLVAAVVIMGFADRWRGKMHEAQEKQRTDAVRRLVRLDAAAADVHDALAYQKRANEASKGSIRRAEELSRDNASAAEANLALLEESREANASLAAKYAAGTDLLAKHAQNMNEAAEAARVHALSRASQNARLLRELERDIEALYKGATTPSAVEAEVAEMEAELSEIRRESKAASDGFYSKVADMLDASEVAQRETSEEISTMYATKEEAESQGGQLLAGVEAARAELESRYDAALSRAGEVEAACGLRNSQELDPAALDAIQASYDDIEAKMSEYASVVGDNEAKWGEFDSQLQAVENSVSDALGEADRLNAEVGAALTDLDDYIKANCTPRESVSTLEDDLAAASSRADRLISEVDGARVACEAANETCRRANDTCTDAAGAAAVNLAEGGVINVDNAGTLSLADGTLSFCSLDEVCTTLN